MSFQIEITEWLISEIFTVSLAILPFTPKFDSVLFYSDDKGDHYGKPVVKGAFVTATVLEHNRERKIFVYKKKRRKGYQRKNGHRQWFSKIKIESISLLAPKKSVPKSKNLKTDTKKKVK